MTAAVILTVTPYSHADRAAPLATSQSCAPPYSLTAKPEAEVCLRLPACL